MRNTGGYLRQLMVQERRTDLQGVKPGQLLLLVTSFADAGKAKNAERLGVIRLYR